jgi:Mce-associated membrane protein
MQFLYPPLLETRWGVSAIGDELRKAMIMAGSDTKITKSELAETVSPDSELDRVDDPVSTKVEGSAEEDAAGAEDDDDTADEQATDQHKGSRDGSHRRVSISLSARSLIQAALIAILMGGVVTFAWLYLDERRDLHAQARKSSDDAHVEKIALDYAVNAATMNVQDLSGWKTKLVAGTSPELNDKLTKAAESMDQILVPLQWASTAKPLLAKVRSDISGIYIVDCFVSVQTKTVQAPDALQSTATYSLTIDSNKNWQITDVGGIGSVVGQK